MHLLLVSQKVALEEKTKAIEVVQSEALDFKAQLFRMKAENEVLRKQLRMYRV